jgi:hypothetical protein
MKIFMPVGWNLCGWAGEEWKGTFKHGSMKMSSERCCCLYSIASQQHTAPMLYAGDSFNAPGVVKAE